jgi:hypothetical protein
MEYIKLTIEAGSNRSQTIDLLGDTVVGIFYPAAIDGTLSLKAYNPLVNALGPFKILSFVSGGYEPILVNDTIGIQSICIEASVNQSTKREFLIVKVDL